MLVFGEDAIPRAKSFDSPEHLIFCRYVRQVRKSLGLTQKEVAARLNKSATYLYKIETGERRMDYIEVRAFCGVVGMSLPEFAEGYERLLRESNKKT